MKPAYHSLNTLKDQFKKQATYPKVIKHYPIPVMDEVVEDVVRVEQAVIV